MNMIQDNNKISHEDIRLSRQRKISIQVPPYHINSLGGYYLNHQSKQAMQHHYRSQLDQLMDLRQKQKQQKHQKDQRQKQLFIDKLNSNKEQQKMKDLAYKNYYSMLLNTQEEFDKKLSHGYSHRDTLKDQHISYLIQEGQRLTQKRQEEKKRKQQLNKTLYKNDLIQQIVDRKRREDLRKQMELNFKEQVRKYEKTSFELKEQDRIKQLDEMKKYREDLDQVKIQHQYYRNKSPTQNQRSVSNQPHHALNNPLSFNIQNPYIIKDMNRRSSFGRSRNHSLNHGY